MLLDHRFTECENDGACRRAGGRWGKKTKRRKRHIVTNLLGNILVLVVHAANLHDTTQGRRAFRKALSEYPSLLSVCRI
ncbi:MAG: hypothetical protein LBM75_04070 [Myxococcales bacterium]|nr:hypothetical protein [Myxococcales bacterium]